MPSNVSNEVVLVLNIAGQAQFLRGMQAASDAVTAFADEVVAANERIIASNDSLIGSATDASVTMVKTSAQTMDLVTSANDSMDSSFAQLSEGANVAAGEVEAAYGRIGAAAQAVGASSTEAAGAAAASGASKGGSGVLGLLSSMRTLVLAGSVYAVVRSFSQYQQGLTLLTTQAGLAASQLGAVKTAIDQLSSSTRTTKTALAQGFYNPISEGFNVGQAATIEKYAAMLAHIGGSPLAGTQGTSYALSTMLQTFGLKPTTQNVARVASLINAGVGAGDLHLPDLLAAGSTGYFNVSQSYGISSQDAMGMLDFFTSQGVPAQEAATRARYFLSLLSAPSAQAQKYGTALGLTNSDVTASESELAALGLRTTKMAALLRQSNGIAKAMSLIDKSVQGFSPVEKEGIFSKLFGGGRSDATALTLAEHVGLLSQFTTRVGRESTPGNLDKAWATWQKTFHAQEQGFVTDISSMAIAIGQDWAPAVGALMSVLGPTAEFFAKNRVAAELLAGVLGGALFFTLTHLVVVVGRQLVAAIIEGAGELGNLINWVGNMGSAAARSGSELVTLTAAETAEGGAAGVGAVGALGKLATAAGLAATALGIIGGTYVAAQLAKKYGEQHPNAPLIGATWGDHPIMNNGQVVGYAGPGPGRIAQDLGRYLYTDPKNLLNRLFGFASGGTIGAGFMTSGPRAVVGEGNPAHPEFVIPTDPAYRSKALGLYGALGAHLMASGGSLSTSALSSAGSAHLEQVLTDAAWGLGGVGSLAGVAALLGQALSPGFGSPSTGPLGKLVGNGSPMSFAAAVLSRLGDPLTQANLSSLLAWENREGGNWHNTARYNPLNTTLGMPGSAGISGNAAGVQAYSSWAQGVAATINTLRSGPYGDILAALAAGSGLGQASLAGLSKWSGGAYSRLASGGVLTKNKALWAASYDTGGYLPEGLSLAFNGTGGPEPVGSGAGAREPIVVVVQLDGKEVGRSVVRYAETKMARR